jgi:hypothetical protein
MKANCTTPPLQLPVVGAIAIYAWGITSPDLIAIGNSMGPLNPSLTSHLPRFCPKLNPAYLLVA